MAPSAPIVVALLRSVDATSDEQSMLQMPMVDKTGQLGASDCACPGYYEDQCNENAFQGCIWTDAGDSNAPWCQCDPNFEGTPPLFDTPPAPAPPAPPPAPIAPPPAPPADGCGGAGVHHMTCRTADSEARGCVYVLDANVQSCGVADWGCYAQADLPEECPHSTPEAATHYYVVNSWPEHAWGAWDAEARSSSIEKCLAKDLTEDPDGSGYMFTSCCTSDGTGMSRDCDSTRNTNFETAMEQCASQGGRLCTADEAMSQATVSQGCSVDGPSSATGADLNRLWTSTPCTPVDTPVVTAAPTAPVIEESTHYYVVNSWPEHAWGAWDAEARNSPIEKCLAKELTEDPDGSGYMFTSCCTSDGTGMSRDCDSTRNTNFETAMEQCASQGGRLCTADEAMSQATVSQGCSVDGPSSATGADLNRLWTSTPCTPPLGPWTLVLQYGAEPSAKNSGAVGTPSESETGAAKLSDADINALPSGVDGAYTFYKLTSDSQTAGELDGLILRSTGVYDDMASGLGLEGDWGICLDSTTSVAECTNWWTGNVNNRIDTISQHDNDCDRWFTGYNGIFCFGANGAGHSYENHCWSHGNSCSLGAHAIRTNLKMYKCTNEEC